MAGRAAEHACPNFVEQARLPRLARADAPPVLLQHGTADTMAPFDQSTGMHDALVAAGAHVELDRFEGAEHFFAGCNDDEVQRDLRDGRCSSPAIACNSRS